MEEIYVKKNEEFAAFLKSEEFLNEIEGKETVEELQAVFSSHGFSMTTKQVEELLQAVWSDSSRDELQEEDLYDVSGGAITIGKLVKWCVIAFKAGWKAGNAFYEWEQSRYK